MDMPVPTTSACCEKPDKNIDSQGAEFLGRKPPRCDKKGSSPEFSQFTFNHNSDTAMHGEQSPW
ncbi:hypothetical protein T10_7238 [Trichinella papuae]|uniref:Uncharacterized protein n=1 Tax=Trichinella papuae TaxID=268474 RepID=A0A0V1M1W0_9BILA|nr:hypothetical protein T10_7238 [Trichinella papuae]